MKNITLYSLAVITMLGSLPVSAGVWLPAPGTTFYWQIDGTINTNPTKSVTMYDIDLVDSSPELIKTLHDQGKVVICYFSAGTWENWRPDANQFPAIVKGKSNGWAGEKWLDIRNPTVFDIMKARMNDAASKGCDGVEPDNVDGYSNRTGFPLTSTDQLTYNKAIASYAHEKGLSVGLKNDVDQVSQLVTYFDWALNEECFAYNECNTLKPFITAGKAVFNAEYSGNTSTFCPKAKTLRLSSAKFSVNLNGSLFTPCW
jgi:hypothetical protein